MRRKVTPICGQECFKLKGMGLKGLVLGWHDAGSEQYVVVHAERAMNESELNCAFPKFDKMANTDFWKSVSILGKKHELSLRELKLNCAFPKFDKMANTDS
jgi:hypothetical protein